MTIDVAQWSSQLDASNFANSFAQHRDVVSLGEVSRILIIGPGQGLDTMIFRWRGYDVTTLDIDDRLNPDFVASAHDLSMFSDKSFDVVIASHVLEHMPPAFLDRALSELARIARHSLIYLPMAGLTFRIRILPGLPRWERSLILTIRNPFRRPNPLRPRFCAEQHYWEVGRPGYSRRKVSAMIGRHFEIRSVYRNPDWLSSINYVLSARQG